MIKNISNLGDAALYCDFGSEVNKEINSKVNFFNLGPKNNWKTLLDKEIINSLQKNFAAEMKELNYL